MWESEDDNFGRDPLTKQALWKTMSIQVRACRPFETWDELALMYVLVVSTTLFLAAYLLFLQWSLEGSMKWYIDTDFNAEYAATALAGAQHTLESVRDLLVMWSAHIVQIFALEFRFVQAQFVRPC